MLSILANSQSEIEMNSKIFLLFTLLMFSSKAVSGTPSTAAKAKTTQVCRQLKQRHLHEQVLGQIKGIGTFTGFTWGDLAYANFTMARNRQVSYCIQKDGLPFFLALNKGKRVHFVAEIARVNIPEANPTGLTKIQRMVDATVEDMTFSTWWKEQRKKASFATLVDKYQPLVDKCTE
jgi:hypothetical protein